MGLIMNSGCSLLTKTLIIKNFNKETMNWSIDNIVQLKYPMENSEEIYNWCEDNCKHKFFYIDPYIHFNIGLLESPSYESWTFENSEDAMRFKLVWS